MLPTRSLCHQIQLELGIRCSLGSWHIIDYLFAKFFPLRALKTFSSKSLSTCRLILSSHSPCPRLSRLHELTRLDVSSRVSILSRSGTNKSGMEKVASQNINKWIEPFYFYRTPKFPGNHGKSIYILLPFWFLVVFPFVRCIGRECASCYLSFDSIEEI